jgi:hypothetical protein
MFQMKNSEELLATLNNVNINANTILFSLDIRSNTFFEKSV